MQGTRDALPSTGHQGGPHLLFRLRRHASVFANRQFLQQETKTPRQQPGAAFAAKEKKSICGVCLLCPWGLSARARLPLFTRQWCPAGSPAALSLLPAWISFLC